MQEYVRLSDAASPSGMNRSNNYFPYNSDSEEEAAAPEHQSWWSRFRRPAPQPAPTSGYLTLVPLSGACVPCHAAAGRSTHGCNEHHHQAAWMGCHGRGQRPVAAAATAATAAAVPTRAYVHA